MTICCLNTFLKTEFRSLALLTSLQLMNGYRLQNKKTILAWLLTKNISIVISPAVHRETKVLTDNMYLTSSEIIVRLPLLYSWLFI